MNFGNKANIVGQEPIDLLTEPTANMADDHEATGAVVAMKPKGGAVVVGEAKLNPSEACALVVGHHRLRINSV